MLDERWLTDSARAHPSSKGYPPVHHSGILRAGVGRIYLYDHQSRKPMSDEIQSYIQEGFVKYIPFEGRCRPEAADGRRRGPRRATSVGSCEEATGMATKRWLCIMPCTQATM